MLVGQDHSRTSSTLLEGEGRLPSVIRVETARLPQPGTFDGTSAKWPAFRDLFVAEVHSTDLDPVTKLIYLQQACIGKAERTLGPWKPTRDNYAAAWETLQKTYDDNYHVVHDLIGQMYSVNQYDRESHDALRNVIDALNSGTRQLAAIATPAELWDQIMIFYAKSKLPRYTIDAWEQQRNREAANMLPTLDQFRNFLDIRAKGRREFETVADSNNDRRNRFQGTRPEHSSNRNQQRENRFADSAKGNNPDQPRTEQYRNNRDNNDRYQPYNKKGENTVPDSNPRKEMDQSRNRDIVEINRCPMEGCLSNHHIATCSKFIGLDVQGRSDVARQNRLCFCCLKRGHMSPQCSEEPCSKCPNGFKHHFRLCRKIQHRVNPFAPSGGAAATAPPANNE